MSYDPMDTAYWMLAGIRDRMAAETVEGANGRARKKTKAQAAEEQIRYATLCELIWNVEGRPGELESFASERLAA